ncbi:MAG: RnfABCDGE type electron transport complex subunit G [Candidatus Omnitrophica bacterium]|nr:RnfABCDGE type electron transport complex subunit G [Candidatus Omnitrophota bacterium]
MKELVRYGLVLGLICGTAGAVLAVVHEATAPKIAQQKKDQEEEALRQIMPDAKKFLLKTTEEDSVYYIAYDENDTLTGFLLKAEGKGYSSTIEVMVGLDRNLTITAIKVLSANETPGLGSRIKDAAFQEQFKDKNLQSYGEIQAITGATISSTAVINAVKTKITQLQDVLRKQL